MLLEHAEDLSNFMTELQKETDRGLPLVGAALIDEKLLETLQAFLMDGNESKKLLNGANSPLGELSSRLDACYALGLIDKFEHQEINIIRKIRNQFAHVRHGLTFDDEKIKGLCTSLSAPLPEGLSRDIYTPRFRLVNSIVSIVLRLFYRPDYVRKEKRESIVWVPDTTWYNSNENPPPKNAGYMGLVSKAP